LKVAAWLLCISRPARPLAAAAAADGVNAVMTSVCVSDDNDATDAGALQYT